MYFNPKEPGLFGQLKVFEKNFNQQFQFYFPLDPEDF